MRRPPPAFVLAAALLGASPARAGDAAPAGRIRPPNILVIMSDEHNAGVLGCYGNAVVRTPSLDGLAARGIAFDAAYTNSPLCVPSRLAFTSGKYISRVGGWNNDTRLPEDAPALPRILNAAGYESLLCGKMHYDRTCRYGFTDLGESMNNSHMAGTGSRRSPDDLNAKGGLSARFAAFHTAPRCAHERHDGQVTAGVVRFLSGRKKDDKPFFLLAGYLAPHFPLIVPEAYWEPYKGRVPMPEIPPGLLDALPLNYRHLRAGFQMTDVPPDTVRRGRELYYGLTQWLDEEVGKVLKALAGSDVAGETVVIYTSDHGENMGEHGLWWKNCLYDSAARIPLIVSWPARWKGGQRRTLACSMVDVVQTIADLGGAKVPADWNGASMGPWMDDPAAPWRDVAVSEYYAHNIASGYAMLRTGGWKYVYHTPADERHPAQRELFDLKADPGERANLADRPEQKDRIARMHEMLVKELGEDPDRTEQRCRADLSRGYEAGAAREGKGRNRKGKEAGGGSEE